MDWESVIRWPALCGEANATNGTDQAIFWDYDNLLNTFTPDLPPCFQVTVLTWLSCGFLWVLLPFYSIYLYTQGYHYQGGNKTKLNIIKLVLAVLLLGLSIADLVQTFNTQTSSYTPPLALYLDAGIRGATYLLAAIFIHVVYSLGIHSSGIFFCFWLLQVIINIVQFRTRVINLQTQVDDSFRYITFFISYGFIVLSFLLELVADIRPEGQMSEEDKDNERTPLLGNKRQKTSPHITSVPPCPELKSTFPGLMSHWWVTSYIARGYRKPIVFEDLPDIMPRDESGLIVDSFYNVWEKEALTKKRPSLLKALLGPALGDVMIAAVCRLIGAIGEFANPLLLESVIGWVTSDDPYTWKGYALAVFLLVVNFLMAAIYHQFFKYSYISAYRMRSAIMSAVYRKALRLSSATRRTTTVGEIVNLMSVDAQKIHDVAFDVHEVWAAPFMMIITMVLLYRTVGPSAFAGFAVLLIMAPLNGAFFAKKYAELQDVQMTHKDTRIKKTNELLNGIKVLKMYAWENSFARFVKDVRRDELKCIRLQSYYNVGIFVIWMAAPFMVPISIFLTYVLVNPDRGLDPQLAFVTMNLTGILNWSMSFLPILIPFAAQAYVSAKRIVSMLLQDEVDPAAVSNNRDTPHAVSIKDGTFTWGNEEEEPALKNVSLDIKEGSLVAVVGQVGSGKSSLISAMLGELQMLQGSVNVKSSIAYIPQQAWIQNATLKDNILFGKQLKVQKYTELLEACALTPDLKVLEGGDQTEIGEKGINLSGGQKQRVSLARAVYQNRSIYLLDDPLSAVDSHVGKHIFENVIGPNGLLNTKTRILVTHGVTYLPQCDVIIVMRHGVVSEVGNYQELLQKDGAFAEFLRQYLTEHLEDNGSDNEELQRQLSTLSEITTGTDSEQEKSGTHLRKRKRTTSRHLSKQLSRGISKEEKPEKNAVLIEEEEAEIGSVSWDVLKYYASAATMTALLSCVIFTLVYISGIVANNIWLAAWTDDPVVNGTQPKTALRIGVYAGLGLVEIIGIGGVAMAILYGGVFASEKLHSLLLERIIRAPMSFFDTTPTGRIVNRFSTDMDKVDNTVPMYFRWLLYNIGTLVSTLFVICYSTPLFITVLIPLCILYYFIQRVYIAAVRQMKRIDSIRKSPIYVNFDETLHGVTSIRAFCRESDFIGKNDRLINENIRAWYPIVIAQRWLGFFLDSMGAVIIFSATIFAVLARGSITGGLVGLSINFSMQTTWVMNMMVRNSTDLETHIVSAERIKEYSEVAQEEPWEIEDKKPPETWPDSGAVQFRNYSSRYRPGLDLVLKNLNFSVLAGEKIGIVGRTGAGKSSVTVGLFRIVEPASGNIIIDNVDISKIGLHDLRNKLTIIPQDPVLFAGSLRTNLDPLDTYTDTQIWDTLELAHLKGFVKELTAGLTYEVGEGGEALSVGQRQLVCLARALLRKSQILVLDEATAAVDLETDDLIQATIRSAFKDCTVLTIAHRLNTILDYDRVLVLDQGEIQEFDKPQTLLDNQSSIFHSMATDAGLT